jgi:hypothetical protein
MRKSAARSLAPERSNLRHVLSHLCCRHLYPVYAALKLDYSYADDSTEPDSDMADDHIRYDILAQEALRGVMRKVLAEVARTGLPGNHHFFITFLTGAPGVRVSSRLRERYPEQMTIVIQFQYWDLKVSDTGFEVGLSFSDVPEKLEIPFSAVRGFYDPSVNFELEFDVKTETSADEEPAGPPAEPLAIVAEKKPETKKKAAEAEKKPAAADAAAKGAEVVSLDAFRKK